MSAHHVVLIVEDDASVREATRSLVRSLGWDVRTHASAEELLHAETLADVACIISDVQMPGLSGIEMVRRLLERGAPPPIIFITAFASDLLLRQAREVGALCVFSKPVDAAQIGERLDAIRAAGTEGRQQNRPDGA
ncbi:Response regulator receiver protein [Paraburkholderia tropica]|uniref:response regulator n=1 Tax=Paraburkholderia tropica TaxID=92647 RepID=UPI001CB3F146|nr:response regulator [Paraburkholderia tropica]CAG9209255.1 Response regulator receiver protein [Paraburkholderia tropica]